MPILLFTTRSVSGNLSAGLLANLAALETESSIVDLLTVTKTDRSGEYIKDKTGICIRRSINPFVDHYVNSCLNANSWQEIYDSLDVSCLKNYTGIYIMGGLLSPSSDVYRYSKKLPKFLESKLCIKFRQVGKNVLNILAIIKAHKEYGIPVHEFSYDTDELCCSLIADMGEYYQYHIYDIPRYNMRRLDSLLYHLDKQSISFDSDEKIYDFTFGYTIFPNGGRPNYVKYVEEITKTFEQSNIYIINKLTGEDTSIPRENYLSKIQQSRFTLIIPSYDNKCFSLYRFIESIKHDCLPIIHPSCYTKEVEDSFDCKFDKIIERVPTEDERLEFIKYYKEKMLTPKFLFVK